MTRVAIYLAYAMYSMSYSNCNTTTLPLESKTLSISCIPLYSKVTMFVIQPSAALLGGTCCLGPYFRITKLFEPPRFTQPHPLWKPQTSFLSLKMTLLFCDLETSKNCQTCLTNSLSTFSENVILAQVRNTLKNGRVFIKSVSPCSLLQNLLSDQGSTSPGILSLELTMILSGNRFFISSNAGQLSRVN